MATITTLQKAPVLDANDAPITGGAYAAVSSDTTVVTVGDFGGNNTLGAFAAGIGTATISVTRNADGAVATVDVTVVLDPNGFAIHLGTPVPK